MSVSGFLRLPLADQGEVVLNKLYKLTHRRPRELGGLFTRVTPSGRRIPNQVFMTWKEPRLAPLHALQVERFRKRNADFSFEFYDDARMALYMETHYAGHPILEVFRHVKVMASKADIWRYCILLKEGGVYCDIDSSLTLPLRTLLRDDPAEMLSFEGNLWKETLKVGVYADPAVFRTQPPPGVEEKLDHPERVVLNWFLCFSPGHPVLTEALDLIVRNFSWFKERTFDAVWPAVVHATGPLLLTQAVWASLAKGQPRPAQFGIDFDGFGQYKVHGSEDRLAVSPTYFHLKNTTLGAPKP